MRELAVNATAHQRKRRLSTRRKLGISRASAIGAGVSLVIGFILAWFSHDPAMTFGAMALLALIFLTLWQENEPPLMMMPALYQWLSVSVKPLNAALTNTPLNDLAEYSINLPPGIWLGYACVGAVAIGIRVGMGKPKHDWNAGLRIEASRLTQRSLLTVAISAILIGHFLFFMMRYSGPAAQLVYSLSNVRFAGLFALAYWAFINRRGYGFLVAALLVEILIGITGFFSDFKTPIFIIGFAALAAGHRPRARDIILLGALISLLVYLGSFWSYVKADYRLMVSGGTMEQVVVVPLSDRIDFLSTAAKQFDSQNFQIGLNNLLKRQSYVDFLAATMQNVPSSVPHEGGKRLGKTVLHVLTPRILFPNKAGTEFDTDVTALYTGLPINVRSATSISIGWAGEYYIDFGTTGAVICSLLMGVVFGVAYRLLRSRAHDSLLLAYGVRATMVSFLMSFDTALIKYVGGAGVAFAGAYLIQRFVVPSLSRNLRIKPASARSMIRAPA